MSAATLATRVKSAREGAQLTMRGIAGVDHSQLSRIESGKVTDPGIATMTAIAKATGKTIDELMGAPASAVRMIELRDIEADPNNPRTVDVGNTVDREFVDSIKEHGLLQAVTVRRMPQDHAGAPWRIAFGGRRYAALVLLHGPKSKLAVPAMVKTAEGSDLLLKQLVENVARADMNPWDLAKAIGQLVEDKMDTQAIASALGRKRRWVQEQASVGRDSHNAARIALQAGQISISQAVAIAAEKNATLQDELVRRVVDDKLNEDEIRAITADRRDKEVEEKHARERSTQLDIEDFATDRTQAKYPTANEHGIFTCKATVTAMWTHKRGHFEIQLVQYGDHKWCAGYSNQWRSSTSGAGPARDRHKHTTAAVSFLDCAHYLYPWFVNKAKDHPEDLPAMHQLHDWIATQLVKLDATARVQADWKNNNPPPAKPKAKAAPPPTKAKALPKIDITEPPAWARPMQGALFMYHSGRDALLCKGWRHMAKTFSEHLDADQEELRQLYNRDSWASDTEGKPFDFGGAVVRLKDAP